MSNQQEIRFIRLKEVAHKTGLSHSGIYDLMGRGIFPKQIKLGGGKSVAWLEHEVVEWQNHQVIASRGAAFEVCSLML